MKSSLELKLRITNFLKSYKNIPSIEMIDKNLAQSIQTFNSVDYRSLTGKQLFITHQKIIKICYEYLLLKINNLISPMSYFEDNVIDIIIRMITECNALNPRNYKETGYCADEDGLFNIFYLIYKTENYSLLFLLKNKYFKFSSSKIYSPLGFEIFTIAYKQYKEGNNTFLTALLQTNYISPFDLFEDESGAKNLLSEIAGNNEVEMVFDILTRHRFGNNSSADLLLKNSIMYLFYNSHDFIERVKEYVIDSEVLITVVDRLVECNYFDLAYEFVTRFEEVFPPDYYSRDLDDKLKNMDINQHHDKYKRILPKIKQLADDFRVKQANKNKFRNVLDILPETYLNRIRDINSVLDNKNMFNAVLDDLNLKSAIEKSNFKTANDSLSIEKPIKPSNDDKADSFKKKSDESEELSLGSLVGKQHKNNTKNINRYRRNKKKKKKNKSNAKQQPNKEMLSNDEFDRILSNFNDGEIIDFDKKFITKYLNDKDFGENYSENLINNPDIIKSMNDNFNQNQYNNNILVEAFFKLKQASYGIIDKYYDNIIELDKVEILFESFILLTEAICDSYFKQDEVSILESRFEMNDLNSIINFYQKFFSKDISESLNIKIEYFQNSMYDLAKNNYINYFVELLQDKSSTEKAITSLVPNLKAILSGFDDLQDIRDSNGKYLIEYALDSKYQKIIQMVITSCPMLFFDKNVWEKFNQHIKENPKFLVKKEYISAIIASASYVLSFQLGCNDTSRQEAMLRVEEFFLNCSTDVLQLCYSKISDLYEDYLFNSHTLNLLLTETMVNFSLYTIMESRLKSLENITYQVIANIYDTQFEYLKSLVDGSEKNSQLDMFKIPNYRKLFGYDKIQEKFSRFAKNREMLISLNGVKYEKLLSAKDLDDHSNIYEQFHKFFDTPEIYNPTNAEFLKELVANNYLYSSKVMQAFIKLGYFEPNFIGSNTNPNFINNMIVNTDIGSAIANLYEGSKKYGNSLFILEIIIILGYKYKKEYLFNLAASIMNEDVRILCNIFNKFKSYFTGKLQPIATNVNYFLIIHDYFKCYHENNLEILNKLDKKGNSPLSIYLSFEKPLKEQYPDIYNQINIFNKHELKIPSSSSLNPSIITQYEANSIIDGFENLDREELNKLKNTI